jgi:hypothetical protein
MKGKFVPVLNEAPSREDVREVEVLGHAFSIATLEGPEWSVDESTALPPVPTGSWDERVPKAVWTK